MEEKKDTSLKKKEAGERATSRINHDEYLTSWMQSTQKHKHTYKKKR